MENRKPQSREEQRAERRDKATALVPIGEKGIILRTFEELRKFAELAVDAGAAPKGMSPGAAALAIQAGLERGLGPLAGLRLCVVINGNLAWNAQGASALIRRSTVCKPGTLAFWFEGEGMDRKGVAVAHRVGYKEPSRREFTWAEAVKAKLTQKDNWIKYPDRHLQARALGFLARDIFSDVLVGFPLEDEAIDFDDRPPVEAEVKVAGPPPPPPPAGPDPVLEALEKAPAVIDVEPVDLDQRVERANPSPEQGASLRSKLNIEPPPVEKPETEPPPPPPPLPSQAEADPAEVIKKARSRSESQYQGSHGVSTHYVPTDATKLEISLEGSHGAGDPCNCPGDYIGESRHNIYCPKSPQYIGSAGSDGAHVEDDPTPPRGIRVVSPPPGETAELPLDQPDDKENRAAAHLAADAELADQEKDRK